MLSLKHNLKFEDLYSNQGLKKLDSVFAAQLNSKDPNLYHKLMLARSEHLTGKAESDLIIELAPTLEYFISDLFSIESEVAGLSLKHNELANVFKCKRLFVQRQAAKSYDPANDNTIPEIISKLGIDVLDEIAFSNSVLTWETAGNLELLEAAKIYAAWAVNSDEGRTKHADGVLFKVPKKVDLQNLIPLHRNANGNIHHEHSRNRDGFNLTDKGHTLKEALDQATYCIHCHNQAKDSCSKGMKDKDGAYKTNELKIAQAGCPLEEKISEMNLLKSQGSIIGALATAIIDNPMLAATGHRICNDCMKSCIYQKQEPVNIPMVETQTLNDVLELPWGFEIYSLLTRWNPLNFKRTTPKDEKTHKILIAGLGPAGFTLAHHLLNEGFTVVGIDGLKIEPLDQSISGIDQNGIRHAFTPIKNTKELYENLGERVAAGFGGVAEYGITARWNKNYLKLIRLLLERRAQFRMYGGVRFGSNITYNTAWQLGFDHIALAMGAGKPNLLSIPNGLAKGVRTASDFLMALQLTGAARKDTIANLQVRLPVVVIGGGLTAVDTATESLAYYPIQVEKFLTRYEKIGEDFLAELNPEELEIAKEFIDHANQLRAHPEKKLELLQKWGGAKVVYRRTIQEAPAYRLNHEEVEKALEEGIEFVENITPTSIEIDQFGNCSQLVHEHGRIEAKTVYIAAGTNPNTVLASEDAEHFKLDEKYFQVLNNEGTKVVPEKVSKPKEPFVLTSLENNKSVSFFGDMHPSFVGNVVKAMGSAKQGFPIVSQLVSQNESCNSASHKEFFTELDKLVLAKVEEVIRLAPKIIEVVISAPLASRQFEPGQFYRIQNFEANAPRSKDTVFAMEGLALTGAWVDKDAGKISTIILEMGGSSDICKYLKKGEPIVLMGPTGTPTEIPNNETVMLVGGGLGNAVLFSIGKAMRANGCKVLYFAGYRKAEDRYKISDIEEAADNVIWCCDETLLSKQRPQDFSFHSNIIKAIEAYASGALGEKPIALENVDRIIAIGSDKMMAAVAYARHNSLKPYFKNTHVAIGSINSPMQCMMKEICGQCIQRHIDVVSGEESYVYSCFNQDQELDSVDFNHLNSRLTQNSLQEKVCKRVIANSNL
jgi:NADPH-dependent glutamate synthase beta subunit-like oxidoreductase/NAD(P)H-flavin reductase